MAIDIREGCFHLSTQNTSYIIGIYEGFLFHHYYGKKLIEPNLKSFKHRYQECYGHYMKTELRELSFESDSLEYPNYGRTDFKHPAIHMVGKEGHSIIDLTYREHKVMAGKYELVDLPHAYAEDGDDVESLIITLVDDTGSIEVDLFYGIYTDYDVITRATAIRNTSEGLVRVESAQSMSIQMPTSNYDLLSLCGAWARERHVYRQNLHKGSQCIESLRGASSHQFNPFMALVRPETTENLGEAYGFSLVYSGNFIGRVQVDQHDTSRITMGINPFEFCWHLQKDEVFYTPECVMTYVDKGLSGMSHNYHRFYRERLCRGTYRDKVRPIIYNNWEVTFFDFDHDQLIGLAKEAKACGMELFVLDDGWFGHRNNAAQSLGDWWVNKEKLPYGLKGLGEEINKMGLKFGLWLEPEMISPVSHLYNEKPEWCISVPRYVSSLGREQLVLDYSNPEVIDYIITIMTEILGSAPIDYVKWDMNRYITDAGSFYLEKERQKELFHRYILGLYKVLEILVARFPHILFESCAGGGGRFDPGMLYYMPQTWTSDNTDAIERIKIQYGTSLVYPPRTMGAHVSPVPNHHVNRSYSLRDREHVAMMGNFGYELNLMELTGDEKTELKEHIEKYKCHRQLLFNGDYYRLISPFENRIAAWMFVDENKEKALLFIFTLHAVNNTLPQYLHLKGLDSYSLYEADGEIYSGSQLMNSGLQVKFPKKDGGSRLVIIEKSR